MKMIAVFSLPRMLTYHRGEFEAVELGHADVDKNNSHFVIEQILERLSTGLRLDEILRRDP